MEFATQAIDYLTAWDIENPSTPPNAQMEEEKSVGRDFEGLKAIPEIRPDDYRWFVHAPGKGWSEIDPDPELIARQSMIENDAFGERPGELPPLKNIPVTPLTTLSGEAVQLIGISEPASSLTEEEREGLERDMSLDDWAVNKAWVKGQLNNASDEFLQQYVETARKDGFIHAIQVMREHGEKCRTYPYTSCTLEDLIQHLKEYAGDTK